LGPGAAFTRIFGIELESPRPIEILPLVPLEVGPRVLGEGNGGGRLLPLMWDQQHWTE
jgi:hypothetical protein